MRGTTAICVALLAACGAPAMAADADTQLWITGTIAASLADDVNGSLDLSQRFRETGNQQLVRGTVEYRLSPVAAIGGGATYVVTDGGPNEFRPHQQVTLTFGSLALRSVVEERMFEAAARPEVRLRERARLTERLSPGTRLSESAELLYIAQPQNRATQARWDSWRGIVMVQQKLAAHVEGSLGYQFVYAPKPTGPDKISHIPLLTVTWRP